MSTELRDNFPVDISYGLLKCLGLPNNIAYVAAEVSHFFSYQTNLIKNNMECEPCVIIVRESQCTNTLFKIDCSESQKNYVTKHIAAAELYIDDGKSMFKNWQMKLEIQTNTASFDLNVYFDVDIKSKELHITKSEYMANEEIGRYMTSMALTLP